MGSDLPVLPHLGALVNGGVFSWASLVLEWIESGYALSSFVFGCWRSSSFTTMLVFEVVFAKCCRLSYIVEICVDPCPDSKFA